MEVYIGGRAQGKLAFVREKYPQKTKIADGKYAAQEECLRAEIIDHFHLYLAVSGQMQPPPCVRRNASAGKIRK